MRDEVLDHTADVMIKCTGQTLEECFANAAYAMFNQVVDATRIAHHKTYRFEVSGNDNEERLYAFLSELLFFLDCNSVVFNEFEVSFDNKIVKCEAHGEDLDPKKHHPHAEIKAVTYHMLSVNTEEPSLTVVFDV